MTQVTIYRCPLTPAIRTYTQDLTATLLGQDVRVDIRDGDRGQFLVVLDGQTLFANAGKRLPAVVDVGQAIEEAGAIGLAI